MPEPLRHFVSTIMLVGKTGTYLANEYCLLVGNFAFFFLSPLTYFQDIAKIRQLTEICKPQHRIILTVQQPLNTPHNPQTDRNP